MATTIKDSASLELLAKELLSANRNRPVCLISTPNHSVEPAFDVEQVDDEVSAVCDVYLVEGGDLTRELALLLPSETHVYGGAARVYPLGFSTSSPEKVGKVRYVYPAGALAKSTERLTSDIWAAANEAGLLAKPSASAKEVVGIVKTIFDDSLVLLELGPQSLATIRQETTFAGVPMSWLFKIGQKVKGKYDSNTRIFTLDRPGSTVQSLVAAIGLNHVTFGLVKETDRKTAKIALHPDVVFELRKDEITGNPRDVVSDYLAVGDVVEVRIYRDPQGRIRLRMDDIDDDETLYPALVLVEGGEPWLVEGRVLFEPIDDNFVDTTDLTRGSGELLDESDYVQEKADASPGPGKAVAGPKPKLNTQERNHENAIAHYRGIIATGNKRIEELNENIDYLSKHLNEAQAQLRTRNEELTKLRPLAAQARKAKVSQERAGSTAYARRKRFETQEEWFREEIRRAWFKDFAATERKKFVLHDDKLAFGPNFLKGVTIDRVDDNELRKLIRNIVFVVTGRNAVEHFFEVHPLKENDKPMVLNGDSVMRMHVENGNPQAMRLHYLKQRDGTHILLKVVNHDDYTI